MKILLIALFYWPSSSAAATVNIGLLESLGRRGHEVRLLLPNCALPHTHTTGTSAPVPPPGCRVYRYGPRLSRFSSRTISLLILVLRSIPLAVRSDVVMCEHHHSHFGSLCAAMTSVIAHRPLVIRVHDLIAPRSQGILQSFLDFVFKCSALWSMRRARHIVVPGGELVKICERAYGLRGGTVSVSYNGVDVVKYTPSNRSDDLRRTVRSRHVIIFSGSIYPGRGLEVLLRASSVLKESMSDLKVLILGDGPDLSRLTRLASTWRIDDSVSFLGAVSRDLVPIYLASADVAVGDLLASDTNYGSTPLKVVEYMASGCVVIVGRNTVSSALIRDGINGLVVRSGDFEDLAKKILLAFSDNGLAKRLRETARQTVEEEYAYDSIACELEEVLRGIVTRSSDITTGERAVRRSCGWTENHSPSHDQNWSHLPALQRQISGVSD